MASASPTLFFAVHLYVPSMCFTVSGNRSSDSFSLSLTVAPEGRPPFSKLQLTVGFGTPLALQLMLVVLPLRTVWSLGKTSTWGEAKGDKYIYQPGYINTSLCNPIPTYLSGSYCTPPSLPPPLLSHRCTHMRIGRQMKARFAKAFCLVSSGLLLD